MQGLEKQQERAGELFLKSDTAREAIKQGQAAEEATREARNQKIADTQAKCAEEMSRLKKRELSEEAKLDELLAQVEDQSEIVTEVKGAIRSLSFSTNAKTSRLQKEQRSDCDYALPQAKNDVTEMLNKTRLMKDEVRTEVVRTKDGGKALNIYSNHEGIVERIRALVAARYQLDELELDPSIDVSAKIEAIMAAIPEPGEPVLIVKAGRVFEKDERPVSWKDRWMEGFGFGRS